MMRNHQGAFICYIYIKRGVHKKLTLLNTAECGGVEWNFFGLNMVKINNFESLQHTHLIGFEEPFLPYIGLYMKPIQKLGILGKSKKFYFYFVKGLKNGKNDNMFYISSCLGGAKTLWQPIFVIFKGVSIYQGEGKYSNSRPKISCLKTYYFYLIFITPSM